MTEENEIAAGCRPWEVHVHLERLDGDWSAEKLLLWRKFSMFVSFYRSNDPWRLLLDSFI